MWSILSAFLFLKLNQPKYLKLGISFRISLSLSHSVQGLAVVQVTFHGSRVQVTAPSINYQTTRILLDLIEHFVKILGLGDTFNICSSFIIVTCALNCGIVTCFLAPPLFGKGLLETSYFCARGVLG